MYLRVRSKRMRRPMCIHRKVNFHFEKITKEYIKRSQTWIRNARTKNPLFDWYKVRSCGKCRFANYYYLFAFEIEMRDSNKNDDGIRLNEIDTRILFRGIIKLFLYNISLERKSKWIRIKKNSCHYLFVVISNSRFSELSVWLLFCVYSMQI